MISNLIEIISYNGKHIDECPTQDRSVIVLLASKLESLHAEILKHDAAAIDISSNKITITGLPGTIKTKVLNQIYKQ